MRSVNADKSILAIFKQRALFYRLNSLRINIKALQDDTQTELQEFGRALAELPALTKLGLALASQPNDLANVPWSLPLLRFLQISGFAHHNRIRGRLCDVPVICAPGLEALEITNMLFDRGSLHRVFNIAVSSKKLQWLRIADSDEDADTVPARELASSLKAAEWPFLSELHLHLGSVDAPGLLQAFVDRAPAIRLIMFVSHSWLEAETLYSLRKLLALERAVFSSSEELEPSRVLADQTESKHTAPRSLRYLQISGTDSTFSRLLLPGLHTLCLIASDVSTVEAALAACPALHTLLLDRIENFSRPEGRGPKRCLTVRTIELEQAHSDDVSPFVRFLAECFPALTSLAIEDQVDQQWCELFADAVAQFPLPVTTLRLFGCMDNCVEPLKRAVSALPALRYLDASDVLEELQSWFGKQGRQIEHCDLVLTEPWGMKLIFSA